VHIVAPELTTNAELQGPKSRAPKSPIMALSG
jgi:hypothetical protein